MSKKRKRWNSLLNKSNFLKRINIRKRWFNKETFTPWNSIGFKMILVFSILMIALGISLITILVPYVTSNMKAGLETQFKQEANAELYQFELFMNTTLDELKTVSENLKRIDNGQINLLLLNLSVKSKKFHEMYYIDVDGSELIRTGENRKAKENWKDEPFLKKVLKEGYAISPIGKNQLGRYYVDLAVLVRNEINEPKAVVGTRLDMGFVWDLLHGQMEQGQQKMLMFREDGSIVTSVDKKPLFSHEFIEGLKQHKNNSKITGAGEFLDPDGQKNLSAYAFSTTYGWGMMVQTANEAAFETVNKMTRVLVAVIFVSLLVIVFIAGFFAQILIKKPLAQLIYVSDQIAKGDLTQKASIQRKDEIGQLSLSFEKMVESLATIVDHVHSSVETISSASHELNHAAQEVSASSEEVAAVINEVSGGSDRQSQITRKVDDCLDELLALAEGMSEKNHEVEHNAMKTKDTIEFSKTVLDKLNQGVETITVSTSDSLLQVQKLEMHASEIVSIIETSNEIAKRTNLLALNATIEAARAGEHGRGFTVVANEVKKLAEQSHLSSQQIEKIIRNVRSSMLEVSKQMENSVDHVKKERSSADEAKVALNHIIDDMSKVVESVEEMKHLLNQQRTSIREIQVFAEESSGVANQTAMIVDEVAASTQQTSSSMQSILNQTGHLSAMAQQMKQIISQFKVKGS